MSNKISNMSTNKNALIRYKTLDKCFRNSTPNTIVELVNECRKALYEQGKVSANCLCESRECPCSAAIKGRDFSCPYIGRRQVFEDIKFMLSDDGWKIKLDCDEPRKRIYQYKDLNYSIFIEPFSEEEMQNIKDTIFFLSKFQGLPKSKMLTDMVDSISERYGISDKASSILEFQNNPYLKGVEEHFSAIFEAVRQEKTLDITYRQFNATIDEEHVVHPYQLRQYNNRWFLVGLDNVAERIWTFPLDRIQKTNVSKVKFREKEMEMSEFFDDVIGVSVPPYKEPVEITLKVSKATVPYLTTKPLHHSQKTLQKIEGDNKNQTIKLKLIPNYEFYSQILAYGEAITVVSPEEVREEMKRKISQLFNNYT
jgi:predicted DNA-binding transcriptional regulator YafY